VDGGELWYNTLTREIILISTDDNRLIERNNTLTMKMLVEKWFYIPEDMSDKTLVYMFWQSYYMRNPQRGSSITLATIFTTTECNARCPYCYEYGIAKNTMTEEIASQSAKYLIKNASNKIRLKWFGGEPLLNTKAIDLICNEISDSGLEYSSYLVTNGYILDKITDDQLKKLWKVTDIQITIDGTREQYQKIKMLPEDAYDKLLNSIERLVRLQITIVLRMHITDTNYEDIKNLVTELSQRFAKLGDARKYIHAYAAPLFEGLGKNPAEMTNELRHKIYDDYLGIDDLISNSGIDRSRRVKNVKACNCMADSHHSIVITPTGDLTPCEHCCDKEIIGNVFTGGTIPSKWYERTPELPECESCPVYPQCIKLKLCEADPPCNEDTRRMKRHNIQKIMLSAYNKYKGKHGEV
jgi:radical SAM protein with 4Fe4S-binding SPASM domain